MLLQSLPQRYGATHTRLLKRWNLGWGRRRRGAKQVFQNPFSTKYRRGPCGIGGDRQHAALSQQTAALSPVQAHSLKLLAVHIGNSVVSGQGTVDERERCVQEVEDTPVLVDDRGSEQSGFAAHPIQQFLIDPRKMLGVRRRPIQSPQLQPL